MRVPERGRRLRWIIILYSLLIFFWLGPEDNHTAPVILIGAGASVLLLMVWTLHRVGGKIIPLRYIPLGLAFLGTVAGFGTSVLSALLMLFKNVRHSHIYPDYPPGLMAAVLERAPIWALIGGLIGLGSATIILALHTTTEDKPT